MYFQLTRWSSGEAPGFATRTRPSPGSNPGGAIFLFVMFRGENEAVGALICSDTVSDALCVALIFAPYNIAFDWIGLAGQDLTGPSSD